ncbi:MAG: DNA-3-methyladenine glycosylase [Ignavibacteria bacterium]
MNKADFFEAKKPGEDFYRRDVLKVAGELLGKIFVKKDVSGIMSGRIVEVEAYGGPADEASHTFRGITQRNKTMFSGGGLLYVYFTYGMYHCCNIVTGSEGEGRAVLIRALEPVEGVERMSLNRFRKDFINDRELLNLASGPGKLCQALSITKELNGISLLEDTIFLLEREKLPDSDIISCTRVGITKSAGLPWRFYIKDNPFVSHKKYNRSKI